MVHAETDSLLQMLKQAQKMEDLLKQVKPDSGLSVSDVLLLTMNMCVHTRLMFYCYFLIF